MPEVCDGIRARLFLLADPAYRAFQQPLIPTMPPERVIGVRTPALRALARELAGTHGWRPGGCIPSGSGW